METTELNKVVRRTGMVVLLGPPGAKREELLLKLLSYSLSEGRSLVLHSKPFVRAERLYELVGRREDLLSHAVFRHVPTLEVQEDAVKGLDVDLARMSMSSVFFDSPSDNYLVSLALAVDSPPKLKMVNASIVRQFAYLKATSAEMGAHVLVTMGDRAGINAVEEYLLRYWPDLIVRLHTDPESDAEFESNERTGLPDSNAKVISVGG